MESAVDFGINQLPAPNRQITSLFPVHINAGRVQYRVMAGRKKKPSPTEMRKLIRSRPGMFKRKSAKVFCAE